MPKKPSIKKPSTKKSSIWDEIVNYDIEMKKQYDENIEKKFEKDFATIDSASNYLKKEVYPYLIPAFERCCVLAMLKNAIKDPKQVFNGIDSISEYLWNTNPKYPERKKNWTKAYFIYKNEMYTKKRPIYPLHWVLTRDQAALIIQRNVRGYNVRKDEEVQEMRNFWKTIKKQHWKRKILKIENRRSPHRIPFEDRVL